MRITLQRTITVEYTFTDEKPKQGENEYSDLSQVSTENIIHDEKRMMLSSWFKQTEYELLDDDIQILK